MIETDGNTLAGADPADLGGGAVAYLLITFVVTFFTAALVAGARERLTGGRPSLGSAFSAASRRLPEIFLWSLLTGTVGLTLNAIENRGGILVRLVVRAIGMSWRIVTWLAVPVIVAEGTGPSPRSSARPGCSARPGARTWWVRSASASSACWPWLPGLVIAGLLMVTLPGPASRSGSCGWPRCRWSSPP